MKRFCSFITIAIAAMVMASSCDSGISTESAGSQSNSSSIKVNVLQSETFIVSKSADIKQTPVRVFLSKDDDFTIEEYVSSIDEALSQPETKGTIVSTAGINRTGESFTVNGWGMVSESKGKPELATNHIPSYTVSYSSGKWSWDGGAAPKWINENNLHIWSYYPVGKIEPEIVFDDKTPSNNTASFEDYTTDGTDLLIGYNKESREFEKDSKGNHTYDTDGILIDPIIGDEFINVAFYHALAAVKFELETSTTGADIHSITLCYVDSSNQIVATGEGIATTGDCVATGSGSGSGSVSFDWDNLDDRKALHYEYSSSFDGEVLFMIPQEVQNIKVIVEFSKSGCTYYYTRIQNIPNETWDAGYCYTYKLKLGEFHVPGEVMSQLTSVEIPGLKPKSGSTSFVRPETSSGAAAPIPIKGVTKMGLAINGYGLGAKPQDNQTVYMYCNKYGSANSLSAPGPGFPYDFAPVTFNGDFFVFGGGGDETYYNCYSFTPTEDQEKHPASNGVPGYYVFDTAGETEFLLYFKPSAGDNSGGFMADLKCLMVLEVEEDSNIPSNFPLTPWP